MTKAEIIAEQAKLTETYRAARVAGDREGAVKASAILSAFIAAHNPPKTNGRASRAGQRQAAERRALHGWR